MANTRPRSNVLPEVAPSIYSELSRVVKDPDKIITKRVETPAKDFSFYILFLNGKITCLGKNRKMMVQDATMSHRNHNGERTTDIGGTYFGKAPLQFNFSQRIERPKGYREEKHIYHKNGNPERIPLVEVAPALNDMFEEDKNSNTLDRNLGSLTVELSSQSRTSNPAVYYHYNIFLGGHCIGTLDSKISSDRSSFSHELSCSFADKKGPLMMRYYEEVSHVK